MTMIEFVGIYVAVSSVAIGIALAHIDKITFGKGTICAVGVMVGLVIFFNERVTEVSLFHVGSIKAASKQAQSDAKAISEIRNALQAQKEDADQKIKLLNAALTDASTALIRVKQATDYTLLVNSATAGSRKAFEQLINLSRDSQFEFRMEAGAALLNAWTINAVGPLGTTVSAPWKPGVDPSKLSFQDVFHDYKAIAPYAHHEMFRFVLSRNDFDKRTKMEFAVFVIANDESLKAVIEAVMYFSNESGLEAGYGSLDSYGKWWEANKDKIK